MPDYRGLAAEEVDKVADWSFILFKSTREIVMISINCTYICMYCLYATTNEMKVNY